MTATVKSLILPELMAAGMISADCIDLIDLSRCRIDREGQLHAPPGFVKTLKKQRPHLFRVNHDNVTYRVYKMHDMRPEKPHMNIRA